MKVKGKGEEVSKKLTLTAVKTSSAGKELRQIIFRGRKRDVN